MRWTVADIDETLKKAGWFEVAPGAGMWRAPDAKGASGRKYTTANAALERWAQRRRRPRNRRRRRKAKSEDS